MYNLDLNFGICYYPYVDGRGLIHLFKNEDRVITGQNKEASKTFTLF